MKKITYDHLKETLYFEKLDNGLEVYLLKKEGFNKTYATFTTKYGSIDSKFGFDDMKKVPDGIAHFLEHKMFETKDGDVFQEFTKDGANANAYTSSTRTCYLFSTTNDVQKNLGTLLDFVQDLHISEESVEKEKGIIEQEIKMYEDDPSWRSYFGTIENMYKEHPVKIDIAGTVESVYSITKEDLEYCYETFYHPSNMLLFVVGNINPEEIMAFVKENQSKKNYSAPREIKREIIIEDGRVATKSQELRLAVSMPKVSIGVKEDSTKRIDNVVKYDLSLAILLDMVIGSSSEKYEQLTKEQVIDDSFYFETSFEDNYGFVMLGGNTKKPEDFINKVTNFLVELKNHNLNEEDFNRMKNKAIGQYLQSFNSLEFIANSFTKFKFENEDLFKIIDHLESITFEDVLDCRDFFNEESITTMTILPK